MATYSKATYIQYKDIDMLGNMVGGRKTSGMKYFSIFLRVIIGRID